MRRNRGGRPAAPPPGGEDFRVGEAGPPVYHVSIPDIKSRGRLVPLGDGEGLPARPVPIVPHRPLLPTADEIATLPRGAQAAYAARCAARAGASTEPAAGPVEAVRAAARAVLETATTGTPVGRILRRFRRDFDRLARLAKEQNWTDDTPVPPDVFGPL